jgi:hypothetical protein
MPLNGQSTLFTKYSMRLTNKHQNIGFLPIRGPMAMGLNSALENVGF